MNRTLSVNVGGYAFTMEENAAEMLEAYLEDIHRNLRDNGSSEEILTDIESRIGELLAETKGGYEFITAGMVEAVRQRIGNPSDIKDEEDETGSGNSDEAKIRKRLYRDLDNKNVGGVCSGLAAYFGTDVVWFRIAWTLLAAAGIFLDGKWIFRDGALLVFALMSYCLLWICIPAARTVKQKCEMTGAPVKLAHYRDYVPEKEEVRKYHRPILGKILEIAVGILLLAIGSSLTIAGVSTPIGHTLIGDNVYNINISHIGEASVQYVENAIEMLTHPTFWWLAGIFILLMGIGMCYAGIRLIFNFTAPKWRPGLVIFLLWLVSLMAISVYAILHVTGVVTTML
ncbi:MAG: PspC domain-containing protein [Bacteroidales bacterium]|nr:PspC domain-containing protein [Candidatus Hennigimonas equi]